jgi:hypothetical protein
MSVSSCNSAHTATIIQPWIRTHITNRLLYQYTLTFESLAVNLRTTMFNNKKILRGAHIAFMCFVRISEQRATFAL